MKIHKLLDDLFIELFDEHATTIILIEDIDNFPVFKKINKILLESDIE